MKVKELRERCQDKDVKLVIDAFVEVYKMLPKVKKEDADPLIENILSGKGKQKATKEVVQDLPSLFEEMSYFIQCAYGGLYIQPNRIIMKPERSKWRFKVKKYLKVLLSIKPEDEYFQEAGKCLIELYRMLSYGCGTYIFSSADPFQSVGIAQDDLYAHVIDFQLKQEVTEETIKNLILLATDVHLSSQCIHIFLYDCLEGALTHEEHRQMLIKIGKALIKERKEKLKIKGKGYNYTYEQEKRISEVNDLIFIFINKPSVSDINYYFQNAYDLNKRETLYRILDIVEIFEKTEAWMLVYDYAIKKKMITQERLDEIYQKKKEKIERDNNG